MCTDMRVIQCGGSVSHLWGILIFLHTVTYTNIQLHTVSIFIAHVFSLSVGALQNFISCLHSGASAVFQSALLRTIIKISSLLAMGSGEARGKLAHFPVFIWIFESPIRALPSGFDNKKCSQKRTTAVNVISEQGHARNLLAVMSGPSPRKVFSLDKFLWMKHQVWFDFWFLHLR